MYALSLDYREAADAVLWAKDRLGLEQWHMGVVRVQNNPPLFAGWSEVVGSVNIEDLGTYKAASIWISPEACVEEDRDPLEVLMHEVGHVVLHEAGFECGWNGQGAPAEVILDHMAAMMAEAYRRDRKKK